MRLRGHRGFSRCRTFAALASVGLLAVSLSALPALGASPTAQADDRTGTVTQQGPLHILPGNLIGPDFEPDKFYVRKGTGDWELTYTPGWQGDGFRDQVRGLLMNLRSANGVFDDESGTILEYDEDFDAQTNTNEFIARLDKYKKHGLLANDVNLQGGNPGFEGAENSAFNSDGSLRQAWMDRAGQLIEAHAERNMVVVLGYFYFRQDDVLEDDDAVRQAVINATDWLIENNYRNVIIEIANEHNDDDYHDIISSDEGMAELIQLAQSRFDNADFRLAVSASRWGDGSWPEGATSDAADLALLHCNGLDAEGCASAAADHQETYDYPIVVNETDNTAGEYTEETLNEENEALDLLTANGASYGLMLNQWNQYAACVYDEDCGKAGFDWGLGLDPGANGSGGALLRNFAHGVFDHMEGVVFDRASVRSRP
jgi:hypothetical protein